MKKKLLIIIAVLLIGGVLFASQNPGLVQKITSNQPENTPVVQQLTVEQTIQYGGSRSEEKSTTEFTTGENAYELLNRTKKIEFKQYSFGKSVESIEGIKGGVDNKYWSFYINGALSSVGAEQYQLKNGDKIEWRLEELK